MSDIKRYNALNKYLKDKFGERTLKICIDGNFTCPNRDGKVGTGGCLFCSERGSGDHINSCRNSFVSENSVTLPNFSNPINTSALSPISENIKKQIYNYFNSYKSKRANKFIAYFQNFTNTYDSVENLKIKYDSALIDGRIVALAVATRPDCIDEDIVKLLKSYTSKYHVWVELGLQTSNNETGKLIHRGYSSEQFTRAVELLNTYNIDVVAHIMVGLPGESFYDLKNTVDFINGHTLHGLKIHSTYVVDNTGLAEMFKNGTYLPISLEYYLDCASYVLTHISPDLIIHRISGDAPKNLLLAPEWNSHKKWIMNGLDKKLKEEDLWQGKFY